MKKLNDGGSAMSLRDYFAAQALAGIYASRWFTDHADTELSSNRQSAAALKAYQAADAMIAQREKDGAS